jgi:membrane associated rhomboid family serine protease
VDVALPLLYAVVLAAAWASAEAPGGPPRRAAGRRPWATPLALVLVGVPSLVQLTVAPDLLGALGRAPGELADGHWWRLVTSLVVQDGGWPGTLFNLAELAVLGLTAERTLGAVRWSAVWLAAGVGAQFWGLLVQPHGGGNSVATFGLAAALAALALVRGVGVSRLLGSLSLVAALVLVVLRDVHSGASVLGAVAGLVVMAADRRGAGVVAPVGGRPEGARPSARGQGAAET